MKTITPGELLAELKGYSSRGDVLVRLNKVANIPGTKQNSEIKTFATAARNYANGAKEPVEAASYPGDFAAFARFWDKLA